MESSTGAGSRTTVWPHSTNNMVTKKINPSHDKKFKHISIHFIGHINEMKFMSHYLFSFI